MPDCTLSSDVQEQLCRSMNKSAAWNFLPGAGPAIANTKSYLTDYENALADKLGKAQAKLDASNEEWQKEITDLEGAVVTDLKRLINQITGPKSLIQQMIDTSIFPLERIIGYVVVILISVTILEINLYI